MLGNVTFPNIFRTPTNFLFSTIPTDIEEKQCGNLFFTKSETSLYGGINC